MRHSLPSQSSGLNTVHCAQSAPSRAYAHKAMVDKRKRRVREKGRGRERVEKGDAEWDRKEERENEKG